MASNWPAAPASQGSSSKHPNHPHTGTNTPIEGASNPMAGSAKKRKHRGGKKRRNRRQSFAATLQPVTSGDLTDNPDAPEAPENAPPHSSGMYRLKRNSSNTSLESEALLDHRGQSFMQPRRGSTLPNLYQQRPSTSYAESPSRSTQNIFTRSKLSQQPMSDEEQQAVDDRTPLMSQSHRDIRTGTSYGGMASPPTSGGRLRRGSRGSSQSRRSRTQLRPTLPQHQSSAQFCEYDVNNPPSRPGSPAMGPDVSFNDVMLSADLERGLTPEESRSNRRLRDAYIDIDHPAGAEDHESPLSASPKDRGQMRRRMTAMQAAEDVCMPVEGMSELGEQDFKERAESGERRRRRRRRWPDLDVLEAWAAEEKEQRTILEGLRTRKVSEPLMVAGRLRPQKRPWHREDEDAPYRFTYFNEEFDNTIHAQTISDLLQPGQTFKDLFIPEPPVLEDSTDEDTDDEEPNQSRDPTPVNGNGGSRHTLHPGQIPPLASRLGEMKQAPSGEHTRSPTPAPAPAHTETNEKPKRYGPRPAFWLDVLRPTDAEMKVISKAFSIHPLTAEDIMMQEAREKVELFKHYYFINYRTFEQDENSEDYLEPVNLYVIVFREGVISFHFSMTPHPANVRRRIRQLQDYLMVSPDWISYGIIDDVTDAYAPLIERIEDEVDEIDEAILDLHSDEEEQEREKSKGYSFNNPHYAKQKDGTKEDQDNGRNGRDMLRRVGECRKKVMSLYRLLGNKADVIKGFAKRCNEHWDVAPRSEIGLYLGDIQDHIVTMTANLSHYENLLSRAHSNYLAQINIRMNERQEKTSDILGKLTVLGTIVLPMNVVTGVWGMNCLVPGQTVENLNWFWAITGSLLLFGLSCYFIAKRVYGIV
ncbi:cora-domain-containing protein [Westerdykella ornata]|uniref:Cora-domain-containing protein n=1 Tax=Westerdykella ornata TaxID=318751 RepID=A0A6A6JHQ1_WESOR|nr:cora-domain-containing protein [Westerdykella ornata]KAF2274779.1 cora-domain-containing protein [Westerdykella ornata]